MSHVYRDECHCSGCRSMRHPDVQARIAELEAKVIEQEEEVKFANEEEAAMRAKLAELEAEVARLRSHLADRERWYAKGECTCPPAPGRPDLSHWRECPLFPRDDEERIVQGWVTRAQPLRDGGRPVASEAAEQVLRVAARDCARLERIEAAAREELDVLVEIEKEPGHEGLYQVCERLREALEVKE